MSGLNVTPKPHLVLVALHELGGEADLEAIAVRAWELFPQQFCWRRFPQYPDKDMVRISLSSAKRDADGPLVSDTDLRREPRAHGGRIKRYALTPNGREKVEEIRRASGVASPSSARNTLDYRRLVEPVLESDAYRQFVSGSAVSTMGREAFLRAFQLFGDASAYVISGRLARTESAIAAATRGDEQVRLVNFIREGRDAFAV